MTALLTPYQRLFALLCTSLFPLSLSAEQAEKELPQKKAPEGMTYIPGGTYTRGEDRALGGAAQYPELSLIHI